MGLERWRDYSYWYSGRIAPYRRGAERFPEGWRAYDVNGCLRRFIGWYDTEQEALDALDALGRWPRADRAGTPHEQEGDL